MKEPREFWIDIPGIHPMFAYDIEEKRNGIANIENKHLVHVHEVFDEPVDHHAELKKAYKEGKVIQARTKEPVGDWYTFFEPKWYPENEYRIKPEPKYRPWKPEEVPVGALLKWKPELKENFTGQRDFDVCIIAGYSGYRLLTSVFGCNFSMDTLLKNHEHSLDHGKTWLPCGVEVKE